MKTIQQRIDAVNEIIESEVKAKKRSLRAVEKILNSELDEIMKSVIKEGN